MKQITYRDFLKAFGWQKTMRKNNLKMLAGFISQWQFRGNFDHIRVVFYIALYPLKLIGIVHFLLGLNMLYIHNIIVSSVWCVVQASKNRAEKRYVKRITAFFVIMFTHTFLPIEFILT